jgi:ferredoxin
MVKNMIQTEEHKKDLLEIAKKLQKKSQSCPTDENGEPTGTYMEYISMMFDPAVASIAKHLKIFPGTTSPNKLSKQLGMTKERIHETLKEPSKRGFIMKAGNRYALASPLLIHDVPFVLQENYKRDDIKLFADLSRKYFEQEKYYKVWETSRRDIPRMKVITVSEEIVPLHEIVPIGEVLKVIDKHDIFAVFPCPCRLRKEIEGGRKCKDKYPIHNCINMGPLAKGLLERGDEAAKEISREEAKEIVKQSVELGLVLATDNTIDNTMILCSCCECCCGTIGGLTRYDNPRAIARANYVCTVDSSACVGCETCISRCKFGAIAVETVAEVNINKCVGCGLCVLTCPQEALSMQPFDRGEKALDE